MKFNFAEADLQKVDFFYDAQINFEYSYRVIFYVRPRKL